MNKYLIKKRYIYSIDSDASPDTDSKIHMIESLCFREDYQIHTKGSNIIDIKDEDALKLNIDDTFTLGAQKYVKRLKREKFLNELLFLH